MAATLSDSCCSMRPQIDETTKVGAAPERTDEAAASVFFRKNIALTGLPVSCKIMIKVKNSFSLFFNGDHIDHTLAVSDKSSDVSYDVSDFLQSGSNTIAIQVNSMTENQEGLCVTASFQTIPDWQQEIESIGAVKGDDDKSVIKTQGGGQ
jgi:hypothetical protein